MQHWEGEGEREHWDCESVLTTLSNLDNHPGRILEPSLRRRPLQQGQIQLSSKTGLPVGRSGGVQQGTAVSRIGKPRRQQQQQQRQRGESCEEKRARKAAVKDARVRAWAPVLLQPVWQGMPAICCWQ